MLPNGLVMVMAIRAYHEQTNGMIGLKPADGISIAKVSPDWLMLIKGRAQLDLARTRTVPIRHFQSLDRHRALDRALARTSHEQTNGMIGLKPADGISIAKVSPDWLMLIKGRAQLDLARTRTVPIRHFQSLDRHRALDRALARTSSKRLSIGQSPPRHGIEPTPYGDSRIVGTE